MILFPLLLPLLSLEKEIDVGSLVKTTRHVSAHPLVDEKRSVPGIEYRESRNRVYRHHFPSLYLSSFTSSIFLVLSNLAEGFVA